MKAAIAGIILLAIVGCAGMQTVSECHETKLACPVGTQKECYQEQGKACECQCHPLDQTPFTPIDEVKDQ